MSYYQITVQKGIPMPKVKPRGRAGTTPAKYPWAEMDVGDSFLFPPGVTQGSLYVLTSYHSRNGKVFKVCKTAEGYRCWRTE
jgi:hypothetical protein